MASLDYSVNPLWQFLESTYGFEEAFRFFGPYAGASIRIRLIDPFTVESSMELVMTNTNYVGSHFGGSLYSMCDPFFMFILMNNLGPGYIVWDKAASIDFVRPGRGKVTARFHISSEELDRIRAFVAENKKMNWETTCEVRDESNNIVATLKKTLYIRRMGPAKAGEEKVDPIVKTGTKGPPPKKAAESKKNVGGKARKK